MPTSKFYPKGGGANDLPVYHELDDAYVFVDVPSLEVPAAEGDLWDPGAADAIIYRVMFNVVNDDVAGIPVTGLYVGREINSAGGLARPYYWLYDEIVPYPGETGWCGPFFIHGDDAIRGVALAVNTAAIHWDVWRVI